MFYEDVVCEIEEINRRCHGTDKGVVISFHDPDMAKSVIGEIIGKSCNVMVDRYFCEDKVPCLICNTNDFYEWCYEEYMRNGYGYLYRFINAEELVCELPHPIKGCGFD